MPISEPFRGKRLPKARIAKNDAAMIAGMSHTQCRIIAASPPHRVDFVEVDRRAIAVEEQDDGEADADFRGGDGDDEQREHLADDAVVQGTEGDEVDVHGVEDEL